MNGSVTDQLITGLSSYPWVTKVCNVAELSACPSTETSLVGNECKIAWLERSMWHFGHLAAFPHGPGGGDFLRGLAREAGIEACPEADVVDREFENRSGRLAAIRSRRNEAKKETCFDSVTITPP